jgi:hypothetical protein
VLPSCLPAQPSITPLGQHARCRPAARQTCTFYVVLVTVLVNGGSCGWLLSRLGLRSPTRASSTASRGASLPGRNTVPESPHDIGAREAFEDGLTVATVAVLALGNGKPASEPDDSSKQPLLFPNTVALGQEGGAARPSASSCGAVGGSPSSSRGVSP